MIGSRVGTIASRVIQPDPPPPAFTNLGTPVVSSRQWTTGLSPNATGTDWNYIAQTNPDEWALVKNFTTSPIKSLTATAAQYANTTVKYTNPDGASQQLRAPNGRIFWPLFGNYTAYYDPSTETINQIGPFVESPPINIHASTIPYSRCFDSAGLLYFATQESQQRPSCVVVTDPTTTPPTQTVLGYVGSGALSYTTYGYYIAPDTTTATKYVYVAYGQNPWQLWALNITPGPNFGVATKLYEVTSTGRVSFTNIAGQGWVAQIDTAVGQPGNVQTKVWCLDGATYPYTVGNPPPGGLARDVTPAVTPLINAPLIDSSGGSGIFGWKPHGSGGAYSYINYPINHAVAQPIESLVTTPDGVFGNAEAYQGWFRTVDATGVSTWFGSAVGLVDLSEGPRLVHPTTNEVFIAGYPDGGLYKYDPAAAWNAPSVPTVNPLLEGYYGPSGIQLAGIKYATCLTWDSGAGRLYCAGRREREGSGAGIGYWVYGTSTFAGTYASPLDQVEPTGLASIATGTTVMATVQLYNTLSAPLYTFDSSLNITATQYPLSGVYNLGTIFATATANVICGLTMNGPNLMTWRYNVSTGTLLSTNTTTFQGTLGGITVASDGSIWQAIGTKIIRIDPATGQAVTRVDTSTIGTVVCMAFFGTKLYMTVDSTLYSVVP